MFPLISTFHFNFYRYTYTYKKESACRTVVKELLRISFMKKMFCEYQTLNGKKANETIAYFLIEKSFDFYCP